MAARLESYLAQRNQLILDDTSLRQDRIKLASLTPAEAEAETIVRRIRREESETVWSHQNEKFPGMAFLEARTAIERTKLFKIMKNLPKGALLHAHLEATVDPAQLLRIALEHPNICIKSPSIITSENISSILPEFNPLPIAQGYDSVEVITSPNYIPNTYVSIGKVRNSWPENLGGPTGFDNWVLSSLTINPSEAYLTHNTTVKIWSKFMSVFTVTRGLLAYEPVIRKYLRQLFESCIEDGISYAEFRMNFTPKTITAEDGIGTIDHEGFFSLFQAEVQEFRSQLQAEGRESAFLGAKLIYTIVRIINNEELQWYLSDCLSLKTKFPDILAGFDIVGPEDNTNPLIYYIEPLLAFQETTASLGIDLPFLFHAGETLGDGNEVDQNLYDAILLGTKRIGHGFSLIKHPTLMKICRERNICIEVCPVSNEILRLTSSMPAHPLPAILNHGVPVALASDDPGIFSNIGLSYDFFQVIVASEVTGLITLSVLARQSLEHSLMDPTSKQQALALWDTQWQAFVDKIVETRGNL